jgi:hypothetical protein
VGIVFGNPLLAWGALAALIPIAIHLLQRRRPRPLPFPAIELIRRSHQRNVRRLRLKRILLLAARTLLLLAIPLALARPRFETAAAQAAAAPGGPAATALVIDASLSMSYVDGSGDPLLERARADARKILAGLGPDEPVTVVPCDGTPAVPAAPAFDRGAARRAIDGIGGTERPADLAACLGAAARALGESTVAGKRIYVFTDLTAAAWRLDAPPPTVTTPQGEVRPEVTVVDAARGEALPNVAITSLEVGPAPEIGPRGRSFRFTVRNFGGEAVANLPVELVVGETVVAKSFVDLPAGGGTEKTLAYRFPSGGAYVGEVRLAADGLRADDARAFAALVPRDLRALVVDGAPSPVRFRDEAFFVEAALARGGASPVQSRTVDAETFPTVDLGGIDLVLLLNVRAPEPEVAARLRAFVEGGGGLFVSVGDNVDADAYNAVLGSLLPLPLHLVKEAAGRGAAGAPPARFGKLDEDHPILRVFAGEGRDGLLATRTSRYFLLQPGREGQARAIASYDDGAPALVERSVGKGRVLLYTSTVDRDWSDWPIQTSFLPTLQLAAGYLSRSLEERPPAPTVVGAPHSLEAPEGTRIDGVVGPDGRGRAIVAGHDGEPPRVEDTGRSGLYRVRGRPPGEETARELPDVSFAVHVDPTESDTRRLDADELRARFGGERVAVSTDPAAARPRETPLWSFLLAAGVLAFLTEGILIRRT